MKTAEVTLGWPPGINGYYACVRGRLILSAKGRAYKIAVRRACIDGLGNFLGWPMRSAFGTSRLSVQIVTHQPTRGRVDLDGRLKALLDALVHANAFDDDSQIDDLMIVRGTVAPSREQANVVVRIAEISETPKTAKP